MNTSALDLKTSTPKTVFGYEMGQSATDLIAFYGATPIVQPSGAAQVAITDPGDGTGAPTNGILSLTGTYNSTILENAFVTLLEASNAHRLALVDLGLISGAA